MKIKTLIFIGILGAFGFCRNASPKSQGKADCKKINSQAMDSLLSYNTSFNRKSSTLEFSLRLLNEAIKCDSSFLTAKFNKVTVLNELGRFPEAINLLDELIISKKDSSLLLLKAPIYDKLNQRDLLSITYKSAFNFFNNKIKDNPKDANIIFGKLFCQSKIYGRESVMSEIDLYLKKYPDDANLKALLNEILQE